MSVRLLLAGLAGSLLLTACATGRDNTARQNVVEEVSGAVNPYLWRASLDTFQNMPVSSADAFGGLIVYDWKSFPSAPNERIKATVYILDTRLRADGVKVALFRQVNVNGNWQDAEVIPDTVIQLENSILERARRLSVAALH